MSAERLRLAEDKIMLKRLLFKAQEKVWKLEKALEQTIRAEKFLLEWEKQNPNKALDEIAK